MDATLKVCHFTDISFKLYLNNQLEENASFNYHNQSNRNGVMQIVTCRDPKCKQKTYF
jgi:hypothetical protein